MLTEQREVFRYADLHKVIGAVCQDGKQRVATVTAQADTFFSRPARVKANGKTVTGYLTRAELCMKCGVDHTEHNYRTPDGGWNFGAGRCADGSRMGKVEGMYLFRVYTYRKNASAILDHAN